MDIKQILSKMSLDEKIGQMMQIPPNYFIENSTVEIAGNIYYSKLTSDQKFKVGSILGVGNSDEMEKLQRNYLSNSRLKIPLLFMADIIHGYETIFPIPLAQSCSFNDNIAFNIARISAIEAQTAGIGVTFSPMADLTRDPRWGRVMEGYGEDPYLLERFVKATVQGYQQDDILKEGNLASCIKHFAGYGAPIGGLDYNTVDMSLLEFYQNYVKGYKAGINAGAQMMMSAFNAFNGVPASINKELMVDILRDKLNFNGVTITDYNSLKESITHRVAINKKHAAELGIKAMIDIEMVSTCYADFIKELINDGIINISDINNAVFRILKLKNDLGLFENPYNYTSKLKEKEINRCEAHLQKARELAHECMVLLKNDNNTFPIKTNQKILLLGPFVNEYRTNGAWSWRGNNHKNRSLYESLKLEGLQVEYADYTEQTSTVKLDKYDLILCALGEYENESGEAKSKSDLHLNYDQTKWVKYAKDNHKKVAVILYNGRPLILTDIINADTILETWFLGSKANEAIADVLMGRVNPCGKLTMSFPLNMGQIPIYYNHFSTGRPRVNSNDPFTSYYIDCDNSALFPFGYGLSYSTFVYKNHKISNTVITEKNTINYQVDIENKSNIDGYEIVQLYIQDVVSNITRPIKELKNYKKLFIEKNTTKTVTFEISLRDLTYTNNKGQQIVEKGEFLIMVGPNSIDLHQIMIELQ